MNKISPIQFFRKNDPIGMARHRLPHWDQDEVCCFATWRLADSIPQRLLKEWMNKKAIWLKLNPKPWSDEVAIEFDQRFQGKIDEWLDHGHESCVLKQPHISGIVANAFSYFEGKRYILNNYVVMPNHVHVLFQPMLNESIADVVKSWKSFTARTINRVLGRTGALWQEDYWDRLIRDEAHFYRCERYIQSNPIKAKLRPGEYKLLHPRRAGLQPAVEGLEKPE